MRGISCEPVEVWLRDSRPERFVWRGRMYFVLFIRDTRTLAADKAAGETDGPAGREVWIVEATPQRSVPATTYELCHDLKSGRWTLSRG